MTVSVWISPSATGEMGGGGSGSQKPALIARTIERLFKEHRVVDLESLCIKFGERVSPCVLFFFASEFRIKLKMLNEPI